jgi:tetratricopeptide (TPR) repeat protein
MDLWTSIDQAYGLSIINLTRGWLNLNRGELDLALAQMTYWYEFNKEYEPHYANRNEFIFIGFGARVDFNRGKIKAAASKLITIESLLPKVYAEDPRWMVHLNSHFKLIQAEVRLAEENADAAITAMKGVKHELPAMSPPILLSINLPVLQDVLPRAYLKKGQIDEAIAEYERLLAFDPDSNDRRWKHPIYHYRLAKLYEEKGWNGKAIEHYEKFLNLWKGADPGIAEVDEARERLAGLR